MRTWWRRGALPAAVVVAAAALVAVGSGIVQGCAGILDRASPIPGTPARPRPPNLVLILSDDQRADTLWAMPHVRRLLAAHGVTFTRFYVSTPVCCPSRSSILAGQYGSHTGVFDNVGPDGGARAFSDDSTLATWLSAGGYTTGLFGKYLNGYPERGRCRIPPGWSSWHAIDSEPMNRYYGYSLNDDGVVHRYGDRAADYQPDVLARKATRFIATAPEPFFAYIAPSNPHRPAVAAPQDVGYYRDLPPYRPPSFDEADVSDKPWHGSLPPLGPAGEREAQRVRIGMLQAIRSLDRDVGRVVDALRRRGALGNTVVAFTSDNGFLWGEHRLLSKTWPYEESIRVPLVVRVPWLDHAVTDSRLAVNIDLAPTFARLAGATPGLPEDGRSLVPLLRGDRVPWRSEFLLEWRGRDVAAQQGPARYVGLHTDRYVYVAYANGGHELYDLRRDPFQLSNLAGEPAFAPLQRQLARRLRLLQGRICSSAPCRSPAPLAPATPAPGE